MNEYRKYMWITDKGGNVINVPEGGFDHSMDSIRYALSNLLKNAPSDFDHDDFLEQELGNRNTLYDEI